MELIIKLKDNNCKFASLTYEGVTKVVPLDDVCRTFIRSVEYSVEDVPYGCRKIIKNRNYVAYVFIIPEGVKRYAMLYPKYDRNHYHIDEDKIKAEGTTVWHGDTINWVAVDIPQPNLVIVATFKISQDKSKNFQRLVAYATKDICCDVNDIELYNYPFTNVFSDHKVCTGTIECNDYTINQIAATPDILINGIGNHDLEQFFKEEDCKAVMTEILGHEASEEEWNAISRSYGLIAFLANHPEIKYFPNRMLGKRLYSLREVQSNWVN